MSINKPEFPDHSHIGRNNCAKFKVTDGRRNVSGPEFGWTYAMKIYFRSLHERYQKDTGFQHTVDSAISFSLSLVVAVGIVVFVLYKYYSTYHR